MHLPHKHFHDLSSSRDLLYYLTYIITWENTRLNLNLDVMMDVYMSYMNDQFVNSDFSDYGVIEVPSSYSLDSKNKLKHII